MNKTYLCLVIFIMCLLSSCSSYKNTSSNEITSKNATKASSNAASSIVFASIDPSINCGVQPNATAANLQFPEKLAVTFPADIPDYNPKPIVLPLVGDPALYKHYICGKTEFYNTETMKKVAPSSEIKQYKSTEKCYMVGNGNKYAIMTFDGKITSGFIYELIDGEDGEYAIAFKGYVEVAKTVDNAQKHGVADIRTGKTVIDMKYDEIIFYNSFVLAKDGEFAKYIDYKGNVFYEVKSVNIGGTGVSKYPTEYFLDPAKKELFSYSTKNYFYFEEGFYVMSILNEYEHTNHKYTKIWNSDKSELCSFYGEVFFDQNLIIRASSRFNIIYKNGVVKVITLKDKYSSIDSVSEKKGFFYVRGLLEGSKDSFNVRQYNMDGDFIKIVPDSYLYSELFIDDGIGSYPNVDPDTDYTKGTYAFYDKNGNILIPFLQYKAIYKSGSFVLCYKKDHWSVPIENVDIYNTSGKLLVSSYFGVVDEIDADKLIVYKNNKTCFLLSADGRMVNIPIDKAVTMEFVGG